MHISTQRMMIAVLGFHSSFRAPRGRSPGRFLDLARDSTANWGGGSSVNKPEGRRGGAGDGFPPSPHYFAIWWRALGAPYVGTGRRRITSGGS